MKKLLSKKYLIIMGIVILLGIASVFLYPIIKEKREINNLKKESNLVANYLLNDEGNIEEINEFIQKDLTTGERHDIEISLDNYLNDVLKNTNELKEITLDDKINNALSTINIANKDNLSSSLEYLKNKKEELNTLNNNFNNLMNDKKSYLHENITSEKLINLYGELIEDINLDEYILKINDFINNMDNKNNIINYLNQNKNTWNVGDEKIVFTKRKVFNEYKKLLENNEEVPAYSLVKDTKGPTITASNITITKGNKINLKDKFKCVDDVDDTVECQISGSYDINKVGSYNIKVTASDTEKNTSNKTVKLTVQEKKVNKKPYYIEVIRNQNVVIVYGLDNNNEYTKIVKVFVCSVGLNGKTPTGTFKTSDKASWGWLVGNVYGQYYTRITGSILFHSVPYYKKAKNELEWEEYNKLGSAASKGCVRLAVRDVKWIYNNCPSGTTVKIYDGNLPSGVSKPSAIKIDGTSPNRGWDPTDPDKNNSWNK